MYIGSGYVVSVLEIMNLATTNHLIWGTCTHYSCVNMTKYMFDYSNISTTMTLH